MQYRGVLQRTSRSSQGSVLTIAPAAASELRRGPERGSPSAVEPVRTLRGDWPGRPDSSRRLGVGAANLSRVRSAQAAVVEIKHANHYSFTDAPFFFAPPGRWLLAQVMGGGLGPAATQQAAADILAAFLTDPLTGAASDLAAAVARYPEVVGRAVEHEPAGVASAGND